MKRGEMRRVIQQKVIYNFHYQIINHQDLRMYYLRQTILDPLAREYNRYIDGYYLSNLLEVKGGKEAGNDYISKVFRSKYHAIQQRYDTAVESVRNPTYSNFLQDNLLRLLAGNAIERLITAYQAYPVLRAKLFFPGTLSHTFTQISNEGLFSGFLKGSLLAAAQFSLVLYPSVYIANKSTSNKYLTFLASYTVFDALLYPVDTIKSILYSETHANLRLRNVLDLCSLPNLYRGFIFKLGFNIPYLTSLFLTTQGDSQSLAVLSWLVTAGLYPLSTIKVRSQLLGTPFAVGKEPKSSFRSGLYRGVVPFILLNAALGWTLRPLFSAERLEELRSDVQGEKWNELRKH